MRKFFTAQDVEYYASKGERIIEISEEDVITSIAKELAEKKGIKFVMNTDKRENMSFSNNIGQANNLKETSYTEYSKQNTLSHTNIISREYKGLISDDEIKEWREEFPILRDVIHLGHCSQSPQSKRVRAAINRYLDSWNSIGMDWDTWCEEAYKAKIEFAKLINADPDEIAIASSVSDAVSSIANSLNYSGSRNKVVVTDAEFPTVNYVWLANQRNGAKVDFISVDDNYQIDISQFERYIDEKTLITSVTHVYYLNGFKQDIEEIAKIAHKKGSLILVDSYQCLGTEPVDVKKMNIDILTSGCLKYLFGIPGIAFIYVNKDLVQYLKPTITGWFGQEDPFLFQSRYLDWSITASRLDTGTPPVINAYAAREGLKIINEVGVERIKDRIDMLSAYALKGCLDRGLICVSPFDVNKKGPTTAILLPEGITGHDMEVELKKRNIIGSGRANVIRLAPHFYTTLEEIDIALDATKSIIEGM